MYAQNLGDALVQLAPVPVATITSTTNHTAIDLTGASSNSTGTNTGSFNYEGQIAFLFDVKNNSGTTPTLDGKLQHSDDNSTFVDVTGATITQVTTTASQQKVVVNKDNLKRYVRVVSTLGGTSPNYTLSVQAVIAKKFPA
jgi:hypothetical protein